MLRRLYDATWGRAFARGYDFFFARAERGGLRELRRKALSGASGRTLELGAGTGLNHDLYPEAVTELVLTEPFGPMAAQLRTKTAAMDPPVEVVEAPAERLPFPDSSFDTVALTLVLCTIPEPDRALAEVARVLKPGGRFLFFEHVRAEDPSLARWQDRLHGPWYVFGHGCHCNRDTLATIERSPLELELVERGRMPKMPPLVQPMLRGTARTVAMAAVALVAATPVAAQGATLTVNRPCYGPGQAIGLTGAGFTPGSSAALSSNGQQLGFLATDPAGAFSGFTQAPVVEEPERVDVFTATDQTNLAITASTPVRLSSLRLSVKPRRGKPTQLRRIKARGFTSGKTLYAHVKRGRKQSNIKIGALKGDCHTLSTKKRVLPRKSSSGVYSVQFDTRRRYSAETVPRITFVVTVYRTFGAASASSLGGGTSERWTTLP